MRHDLFLATALIAIGTPFAHAHKPVFSDGSANSPQTAIPMESLSVSYVVYHEATEQSPRLWLTFEGSAGQQVTFRLGVPFVDRLRDYRPTLAVLGPGFPPVTLPFQIPTDLGGLVLTPEGSEPEFFHEPFTGTDSWIIGDLQVTLPRTGPYYAVASTPPGELGKFWVAWGQAEAFTLVDILSLPQTIERVRTFHEVEGPTFPCFLPFAAVALILAAGLRLTSHRRSAAG